MLQNKTEILLHKLLQPNLQRSKVLLKLFQIELLFLCKSHPHHNQEQRKGLFV